MVPEAAKFFAIGMIGGFGMIGPGIGLGLIGYGALTGIARNPEARGAIFSIMILIAGLAEAVAIYALILVMILTFVVK